MDNTPLSLTHFGHLFEVFATYYLLLGTSERFHDYFGISQIFKGWPNEFKTFSEKTELVKRMQQDWEERAKHNVSPKITNIKKHNREIEKDADRVVKAQATVGKLEKINNRIRRDLEMHFTGIVKKSWRTYAFKFL